MAFVKAPLAMALAVIAPLSIVWTAALQSRTPEKKYCSPSETLSGSTVLESVSSTFSIAITSGYFPTGPCAVNLLSPQAVPSAIIRSHETRFLATSISSSPFSVPSKPRSPAALRIANEPSSL